MTKWPFRGKHQGDDINDIPTSYLEWIMENSKNPDAIDLADRALAFREKADFDEPEDKARRSNTRRTSSRRTRQTQLDIPDEPEAKDESLLEMEMLIRAMVFTAASLMNPKNPWENLDMITQYVIFNEKPHLTDENFDPLEKAQERAGEDDSEPPFMTKEQVEAYLEQREKKKSSAKSSEEK